MHEVSPAIAKQHKDLKIDQYAIENLRFAPSKRTEEREREGFIWGSCRMLVSERFEDYIVDGNYENEKAELLCVCFRTSPVKQKNKMAKHMVKWPFYLTSMKISVQRINAMISSYIYQTSHNLDKQHS